MYILYAIALFVAHYVGDFLLQSREIANNKSSDLAALVSHGILVTLPIVALFIVVDVIMFITHHSSAFYEPILAALLYGILHMVQDKFTWRWFKKKVKEEDLIRGSERFDTMFFAVLGADQMIHMIVLFTIAFLLI